VGPYGSVDATNVYNLVGKHVNAYGSSWGTPFDLDNLASDPLVVNGTVDLNNIRYVRLIDIAGDGSQLDSLGHPIYDGWVTWGSGGADIDAMGSIRHFGETQTAAAGAGSLGWNWNSANGAIRLNYTGLEADTDFVASGWSDESAFAQLANVTTLAGKDYKLLNAWRIDAPTATFSADGGITLFAYFDPAFAGTEEDVVLLKWTGSEWINVEIASVDLDNFLLESALEPGATSAIYAVVELPTAATLTGTVSLGDFSSGTVSSQTVTVKLVQDESVFKTYEKVALNADGLFTLNYVTPGTYSVWVKASHWLAAEIDNVTVVASATTSAGTFTLINGDVVTSNAEVIDENDLNALIANFRGTSPDLDGDGEVNIDDVNIVIGHVNQTGAADPSLE
jgi:hypothetical protein